jgi:hypothetical protein
MTERFVQLHLFLARHRGKVLLLFASSPSRRFDGAQG